MEENLENGYTREVFFFFLDSRRLSRKNVHIAILMHSIQGRNCNNQGKI